MIPFKPKGACNTKDSPGNSTNKKKLQCKGVIDEESPKK